MVIRTVSVTYLREWRETIDSQWKDDLLNILRDNIENFDEVYQRLRAGQPGSPPDFAATEGIGSLLSSIVLNGT